MVYGNAHRLFMQVMLQRRAVDKAEAEALLRKCCKECGEPVQQLEGFMHEVNKEMEIVELALKFAVEEREDSDHICLVLVNLMIGEANRMLSSFSAQELSFVQMLVAELVFSSDGQIQISTAINLGLSLTYKMKASACEELIEKLVEQKWLLQTTDENSDMYLSFSSLITTELNTYLEETFPEDIAHCFFCTKFTFKGYKCQQCKVAVHRDCAKRYWVTNKKPNSCPKGGCNAFLGPATATTASQSKRRRILENADDAEMEVEEGSEAEEGNEEEEDSRQVVRTRSSLRTRKGRVSYVEM